MIAAALLWLGLGAMPATASTVPEGIPRELAVERAARVSSVQYDLAYTLVPKAASTAATETLHFLLKDATKPLLIDFRDGQVTALTINGKSAPPQITNGHIVLPSALLQAGLNEIAFAFTANIGAAGKAITRFDDADDGAEYLYTLFVPMDAEMAFPCFDQPDLKAKFQLQLTAPDAWTLISNTDPVSKAPAQPGISTTLFDRTEPISTYLFAYAAGPWQKIHPVAELPGLYVRKSKAKTAQPEAPAVQAMAAAGIQHLSAYFEQPFPFPKYDMVLIPQFAFGGMEHAGATFLKEESVLFRTAPTQTNLVNRDVLVLHELTHQWFGDFTTMRWFDDLWLKEGFAQYMAYQSLASIVPAVEPPGTIWKRFYEAIKPSAYAIDQTQGTTPIYQNIANLKDAKSAYGAIVYQKAPAVIKQLAFVLGEENFRKGLALYLKQHQYENAQWSDLIHAFETVSGRSLTRWAEMWIRHRGMPQVDVAWSCDSGKLKSLSISQHDILGEGSLWPISSEAVLGYADGTSQKLPIQFDRQTASIPAATGKPCPAYIFANADDHGYGLFLLDDQSRAYVTRHVAAMPNLFERSLLWGSLWASVQSAKMAPSEYLDLALASLPSEHDEAITAGILAHSETALHRYVTASVRQQRTALFAEMATKRMVADPDQNLRIVWFRSIAAFSESSAARNAIKALLHDQLSVPGVQLRPQDRWRLVTALVAMSDPEAEAFLSEEEKRDSSGDGKRFAWIAQAARADAATKQAYFSEYLHNPDRPEDWIQSSLGAFNSWNQATLTEPYLRPALAALDAIKRERKIFFLVDWLNAFIGGQTSPAASETIHHYLDTTLVERDLRLKILEVVDELDRTIAIRKQFP